MSDPTWESKSSLGISLLATLLIGVYVFPLLTLTSFYANGHFPYILLVIYALASGIGVLLGHRFQGLGTHMWLRLVGALLLGVFVSFIGAWITGLTGPELITALLWGTISAFVGLAPEPSLRSTLMWRWQVFGVVGSIIGGILSRWFEPLYPLQTYGGTLYATGFISFVACLLIVYSSQMDRAVLNDGKRKIVLREFNRANHQRLIWMLLIIAGIGAFPSLAAWLAPLRDRLLAWIRGLIGPSSDAQLPITPISGIDPSMLPGRVTERSEPSVFWDMLGWFVLGASAALILWLIFRLGRKTIHRLMDRLRGIMEPRERRAEPRTEYIDISETLETPVRARKPWFRKKETPPSQEAERVRYYYRKWIDQARQRGVEIEAAQTPLEAAEKILHHKQSSDKQETQRFSDILTSAYNAVRYGKKAPNPSEMSEIDRNWKSR
ncbi:DUF4129 domain-containing protein [Paenibacillus sp. ACRRY]|uniref:DUF4129 domain-containing protein n=1 Tax=Paenibacillus sp. ACRRY TaxID=2918208 RepID=UPI001EF439C7|nr:DUF4129 domain-containing protein [Paenibacillus sp. ACRRY]MCG7384771.1 DUF4129 domain-containing protein [Paenibacillus sp. ACRRY]